MQFKHVPVVEDIPCPYCGIVVPEGDSVCQGCSAYHCVRERLGLTLSAFFLFGLYLGSKSEAVNTLLVALVVALGGAFAVKLYDESRPLWMQDE